MPAVSALPERRAAAHRAAGAAHGSAARQLTSLCTALCKGRRLWADPGLVLTSLPGTAMGWGCQPRFEQLIRGLWGCLCPLSRVLAPLLIPII